MNNPYSFTKKKKLAEKIMKIQNKDQLLKIKKIIFDENPSLSVVKNSTGILLYFQNLKTSTYYKLENYISNNTLKKCIKKMNNIESIENTIFSDLNVSSSENLSIVKQSEYKYSNKEKNIIKRKNYEETLNKINSSDDIKKSQSNIFIKKS